MVNIESFWTWYRSDHCTGQAEGHRDAPYEKNMACNMDTPCLYCPWPCCDRCRGGQKRVLLRMTLAPPLNLVAQCPKKKGGGAFPDVACASTKSRCAVSKNSQHILIYLFIKIGSEQSAISPSARFLRNSVYSSTRVRTRTRVLASTCI